MMNGMLLPARVLFFFFSEKLLQNGAEDGTI